MGRRGPPPKPRALKLVAGTYRPDRDSGAPDPPVSIPAPPRALGAIALREWKRLAPLLAKQGLMAEDYRDALAAYCASFERWELAELALQGRGEQLVDVSAMGGSPDERAGLVFDGQERAEVGIANKALELMRKFLIEFGLTPASRTRVKPSKSGGAGNPFGDL